MWAMSPKKSISPRKLQEYLKSTKIKMGGFEKQNSKLDSITI